MVDLLPDDEQEQIIDAARTFFDAEAPLARLRERRPGEPTLDHALWPRIAGLGYLGIGVPEEAGGAGGTAVEEMLVAREAGRALVSTGLIARFMGAHVAAAAGARPTAERILAGAPVALAVPAGDGHHLLDADADALVVEIGPTGGRILAPAAGDAAGDMPCIDESLRLQRVSLAGRAVLASSEGPALFRRMTLLTSAMLAGIAEAARDMTVEYAKVRTQFGKPIGAFQAVKHHCADMAVRCEAAWCQVVHAGLTFRADLPEAAQRTAEAKVIAGDAALLNAGANIQVHGGIGFSHELPAHFLLKRSRLLERVGGTRREHLESVLGGR